MTKLIPIFDIEEVLYDIKGRHNMYWDSTFDLELSEELRKEVKGRGITYDADLIEYLSDLGLSFDRVHIGEEGYYFDFTNKNPSFTVDNLPLLGITVKVPHNNLGFSLYSNVYKALGII